MPGAWKSSELMIPAIITHEQGSEALPGLGRGVFFLLTAPTSRTQRPQQRNGAQSDGIADACAPDLWALLRSHGGRMDIDVAPIQPCAMGVLLGSGTRYARTPEDIPGFLIAFHAHSSRVPRSDLPHGVAPGRMPPFYA